jgi:hypothetical protein
MVRNISRELVEIRQAMARCRGDAGAEPRLTGTWLAHLLPNLLIDTARNPQRIEPPVARDQASGSSVG